MKKIVLVFLFVMFGFGASFTDAENNMKLFKIISVADDYFLSYKLQDNDNEFWSAVEDILKSGQSVKINHSITIEDTSTWAKELESSSTNYAISYNLLENTYKYSNGGVVTHVTKSKKQVRDYILTIKNLPFVKKNKLQTGEEYNVAVKVSVEEDREENRSWSNRWFKNFLPTNILKPTLKAEELYIAR